MAVNIYGGVATVPDSAAALRKPSPALSRVATWPNFE
jgi:hypothetical protein